MFGAHCEATHSKLIAGKCPWCGQIIVDGRAFGNALCLALARDLNWSAPDEGLSPQSESTESLLTIIEQINRGAKGAIPLLLASLRDRDESLREANALGRIGADAKEALPALFLLLDDEDQLVRDAAHEAIAKIEAPG